MITADRAWRMVSSLYPGQRLRDFRAVVITSRLTIATGSAGATGGVTPVEFPSGAIICAIAAPQPRLSGGEIRLRLSWPNGDAIIQPCMPATAFGHNRTLAFPTKPIVISRGGFLNWELTNLQGSIAESVIFTVGHHCLIPRATG